LRQPVEGRIGIGGEHAAGADSAIVRRSARRSMGLWAKILLQLDPRDLLVPA
jgi:hypothetical protein